LGKPAEDIDLDEPLMRYPDVQKVVGDETAERGPDALPVARNDGRVRDRNAERMAEQGDDREPVGAGADHAGFRERSHVRQPRPVESGERGRDEHHDHQCQQRGRDDAHAPQVGAAHIRVAGGRGRAAPFHHRNCTPRRGPKSGHQWRRSTSHSMLRPLRWRSPGS